MDNWALGHVGLWAERLSMSKQQQWKQARWFSISFSLETQLLKILTATVQL